MGDSRDTDWARAKKLCRLSAEEVRMARELGLNPRKLVKNIPSPTQRWKLPVREWVRELYRKAHGGPDPWENPSLRAPNPEPLLPSPSVGEFAVDEFAAFSERYDEDSWPDPDPDLRWTVEDEERSRCRRQDAFRAAADYVAVAYAALAPVEKVVLFGSAARPLGREPSRLRRHAGAMVPHECKDVDLAVWLSDATNLKALQKARALALNDLLVDTNFGVAHHQVDVFLFEPGTDHYLGRLCYFGTCPKGKPECLVPGCGTTLFLRQHEDFALDPQALEPRRTVLLFDRSRPFGPPSLDHWADKLPF
jgi:hypothetical protein